ncbi:MAG: hypothetical protein HY814_12245 [Candidatus Riflebacteria bacterium]|nr:hypothetical protein [Candidatus Riflebacteria bacterium]
MNKHDDRELLRTAMAEASLLPPDDPVRRQLEQDVARVGSWGQEEWLELIRADEAMRLELRQVELPPGLVSQLLLIPERVTLEGAEQCPGWLRWLRGLHLSGQRLAAVALVALLVVGTGLWRFDGGAGPVLQLEELALLASQDHVDEGDLAVRSTDPRKVEGHLTGLLGFPVRVPALEPRLALVGGRPCKLAGHRVAYTVWRTSDAALSPLFQFRLSDFRLPGPVEKRVLRFGESAGRGATCEVTVWSEEDRGYALVTRLSNRPGS